MDRTNWKFGRFNINILRLGITYRNVVFPILFRLMPKRGNSKLTERKELVEKFVRLFGDDCIDFLVAEGEFVGQDWIGWLNQNHIRYYIRKRKNFWISNPRSGQNVRVWHLFNSLRVGEELFYHKLYIHKGEYVYQAGTTLFDADGKTQL